MQSSLPQAVADVWRAVPREEGKQAGISLCRSVGRAVFGNLSSKGWDFRGLKAGQERGEETAYCTLDHSV